MGLAMVKEIKPPRPGGAISPKTTAQVIALRQRDPWNEATQKARQVALARESLVLYVGTLVSDGLSQNDAATRALQRALDNTLPAHVAAVLPALAKGKRQLPSRSTVCAWCASYREQGVAGLLPDHKGRVVTEAVWWGPALEYYNAPSKPDMSAVHRRLVEVDGFVVSYEQVKNYLSGVPAMLGRNSPARIGKNLYRLTEKAYIKRSTKHALPGDVFVADGYRADVYLAHPMTGGIWRPELTVAIDLRSRVLVHWRADEHEGTYAVQNMWAECFAKWGHVPPILYVDNGSGYKNKLMSDELVGFYGRAGVQQIIHALPGNPHGKGWVERFFRAMRDDFLKLWKPELYCGNDMSPEALNKTVANIKAGRLQLPSLSEFSAAFNEWSHRYCHRPHPEDRHVTKAELWAQLQPIPPAGNVSELKRQAVVLTVRRAMMTHCKRSYRHPDLHAFNGQKLLLEYDLMDNSIAVIRTQEGRWVCDAHLVVEMDAISTNRLDEKRQSRVDDSLRRLQRKMDEQKARAGVLLDADRVVDNAAGLLEGIATRIPDSSLPPSLPSSGLLDDDDDERLFKF